MSEKQEWFEVWFDSPYYHILYDHRDEREAENFILNLKNYLSLDGKETILDLACGAGRHSAFISKHVKEVVGLDLSENSIQEAKKSYPAYNLEFYKHDMRFPFRINYFNYIFNFFTSFGYFKRKSDNLKVLQSIYKGLKPNGILVLDFMNSTKAIERSKKDEVIEKQGIRFVINRKLIEGKILKNIRFEAGGNKFDYTESVQALLPKDFHQLIEASGLTLKAEFGDYSLNAFDSINSDRYILVAQKL